MLTPRPWWLFIFPRYFWVTTGGAANGGLSDDGYTNGGNGALATGGSYAATSGQVLSVVVGKGGVHSGASYNADGLDGIVDLTWG